MIVLGLTGSIGMGKSTAAHLLKSMGIPVFDADETVHRLLGKGGAAVAPIGAAFANVVFAGRVERTRLAARVFGDDAALKVLEGIVHPLVADAERRFIRACRRQRRPLIALDIPLLLESTARKRVDHVVVVSCPAFLQEQRVMKRPGMTRAKLANIRRRQMADWRKRRLADKVVPSGNGRRFALVRLAAAIRSFKERRV